MVKKALAIVGAGAILLSMAVPVLGQCYGLSCFPMSSDDVTIHNCALVSNRLYTKADSGDNMISGWFGVSGGVINSGNATAKLTLGNEVNTSLLGCTGCIDDVNIYNRARVYNRVKTIADSGDNMLSGMCVSGGRITSGAASATSLVTNIVNLTSVGVPLE